MKKVWSSLILLGVLNCVPLYAQDFNELLNNITKAIRAVGTDVFQLEGKGKEVIKEDEEPVGEEATKKIEEGKGQDVEEQNFEIPAKDYTISAVLVLNEKLVDAIIESIQEKAAASKVKLHIDFFQNKENIENIKNTLLQIKYLEAYTKRQSAKKDDLGTKISVVLGEVRNNFLKPAAKANLKFKLDTLINTLKTDTPLDGKKVQLVFSEFVLRGEKESLASEITKYKTLNLVTPDKAKELSVTDIAAEDIAVLVKRRILGNYFDVPSYKQVFVTNFPFELKIKINDQFTDPIDYTEDAVIKRE